METTNLPLAIVWHQQAEQLLSTFRPPEVSLKKSKTFQSKASTVKINLECSGVTRGGGKGGHLPPTAELWGRQIEIRMLRTNYKMSNASGCHPVAKSYQDQQGSQSGQLWISVTFQGGISVSSNQRLLVLWRIASPQCFQIARVADFRICSHVAAASQWDGNPAFTMHAVCYIAHAFRAAIKLSVLLPGVYRGGRTRRWPRASKAGAS